MFHRYFQQSARRRVMAGLLAVALALVGVVLAPRSDAVTVDPFSTANGFDGDIYGDYILIGNTVVRCPTAAETVNGDVNNNAATCAGAAASNSGLSGGTLVNDNFTFTATVQNMLDKQPPIVGSTAGTTSYNSGNTYPSTYDALGRRFAVSARLKF